MMQDIRSLPPQWEWVNRVAGITHAQGMRAKSIEDVLLHDLPFGLEKMRNAAMSSFKSAMSPSTCKPKRVFNYLNFKLISLASFACYTAFLVMTAVLTALTSPFYKTHFHSRLQAYVRMLGVYSFDAMRKLPVIFEIEALIRLRSTHPEKEDSSPRLLNNKIEESKGEIVKEEEEEEEDILSSRESINPFKIDPFTTLQTNSPVKAHYVDKPNLL